MIERTRHLHRLSEAVRRSPVTALLGLLHSLLGATSREALLGHPKAGASWEGYVLEQVQQVLAPFEIYFWGTYSGAELDAFFLRKGKRYGLEVKFSEAPRITKSMQIALDDLRLDQLWVIYPGSHRYPVDERITVLPSEVFLKEQGAR